MQQIQIQQSIQIKEKQNQKAQEAEREKQMEAMQRQVEELGVQVDRVREEGERRVREEKQAREKVEGEKRRLEEQIEAMERSYVEEMERNDGRVEGVDNPLRRTQSEQFLEEKIKKLEYKNKQSDANLDALQ